MEIGEVSKILVTLKDELNNLYGEGNWKLRQVSRARKGTNKPSLTITEELERLNAKPTDYVIVAVVDNKILIYRV